MDIMIRQIFKMRTFLACVLAATTGMMLYFCYPFPDENFFLELIFLWARPVFQGLKFFYTLFLFTTPYIAYSLFLSDPDGHTVEITSYHPPAPPTEPVDV